MNAAFGVLTGGLKAQALVEELLEILDLARS